MPDYQTTQHYIPELYTFEHDLLLKGGGGALQVNFVS